MLLFDYLKIWKYLIFSLNINGVNHAFIWLLKNGQLLRK